MGPSSEIEEPAPDDEGDSEGANPMTVITSMPDSSSPIDSYKIREISIILKMCLKLMKSLSFLCGSF